ncbi:uncharacterized protein BDW43DRAFT_303180 [Aspergillus alliaceus]|uniref:uncharacterized protein n=1 Tax=Petromyces alliaceus TaxID=209559 RepID=UPI0012A474B7|nr:uncharacterized protein BDW43DRAFT_303180 [Aspergillus alliaceus]KAB8229445.1 hypothetical protein BDW43DRAFT_303180 [Aspergillus alliaceus]
MGVNNCDEHRPKCKNCERQRSTCDYASSGPWQWRVDIRGSRGEASIPEHRRLDNTALDQPRAQNLQREHQAQEVNTQHCRLLIHWTTAVYQSVSRSTDVEWIWQVVIPNLSLTQPCLLRGIFALSSLHLSLSAANPTDREDLLQSALNYHSQSLQLFAPTLEDLTRSDCNAAFSLSLILILFSFAAPLLVVGDSDLDAIYELHQVCVFVKKMMNFSVGIYETVKSGVLGPLVHIDDSVSELSGSPLTAIACLSDLNSRAYDRNPSHEFQMYQESIDRLVDPFGQLGDPGNHRLSGVFMWVFHVPDRFFELVQKRDAFALIILAHFCVLLHDLRNHWWMSSWGYKVIVAIYQTLDADLRYSLSWALLQIGYTGDI